MDRCVRYSHIVARSRFRKIERFPPRVCPTRSTPVVPAENVPENVRALIVGHLDSVLEVEILLLLYHSRPKAWSADELVQRLRIDAVWAESQLAKLCAQGLVRCDAGPATTYTYAPQSAELEASVAALERAYADRRVSVIEVIFAKPLEKIRSFADAFRVRKDRDKDRPDG